MNGLNVYPAASARAALALAHGAGAGQASQFMVNAARGLAERGVSIATFDFPYITARRRAPDSPHVLEQHWRGVIAEARDAFRGLPLFIGGKSMGGRIASHVAAHGDTGVLAGLLFFGYPLHPPGKPQQRRDAHLPYRGTDVVRARKPRCVRHRGGDSRTAAAAPACDAA